MWAKKEERKDEKKQLEEVSQKNLFLCILMETLICHDLFHQLL